MGLNKTRRQWSGTADKLPWEGLRMGKETWKDLNTRGFLEILDTSIWSHTGQSPDQSACTTPTCPLASFSTTFSAPPAGLPRSLIFAPMFSYFHALASAALLPRTLSCESYVVPLLLPCEMLSADSKTPTVLRPTSVDPVSSQGAESAGG